MSDDRCFCGAEWNDVAEECAAGHPFGEAEKLRAENTNLHGLAEVALDIVLRGQTDFKWRELDRALGRWLGSTNVRNYEQKLDELVAKRKAALKAALASPGRSEKGQASE